MTAAKLESQEDPVESPEDRLVLSYNEDEERILGASAVQAKTSHDRIATSAGLSRDIFSDHSDNENDESFRVNDATGDSD